MIRLWVFTLLLLWAHLCAAQVVSHQLPVNSGTESLPEAVRGVWLTNVASDVLYTREGIEQAVELCVELGLNSIFVVTWNKGQTLYPSQVMQDFTGVAMDPELDPKQMGRDPLQELIDAAHRHNIKVFAWFEFGFAASHGAQGGELIRRKPHWASLDVHGELVTKNGFEWMNALDPEVQAFMTSLVLEVVRNYDVDGIQGDDRLPAMPSEGGYNPGIAAAYRDETGALPPADSKNPQWVQWRANRLNQYAAALYRAVKAEDPHTIVSFSPSVFPWSREQYLQDWPSWLAQGSVDLLIPQVYRHQLDSYRNTLRETLGYVPEAQRASFAPGVLIKVGSTMPSQELMRGMLAANREAGLLGEVFFFYEGLEHYREIIRSSYASRPVRFPEAL
ncbi:glycoside hydrolase family 10 protein [Microbulbifer sp. YPW1]|uniref:glycoside hydrolase family 10 protein n=1 Tax=Microbulbifer sp. YPW1 TaxID=2745199 RepID=UPI0015995AFD|nr:family 10 glycosylhydrolase [Microbulbifer sp. YPW1]QKX17919.1 family 10 glycosylhydrolase [Microbulbifer sp. YPW1]